jgi:hypothetical protein
MNESEQQSQSQTPSLLLPLQQKPTQSSSNTSQKSPRKLPPIPSIALNKNGLNKPTQMTTNFVKRSSEKRLSPQLPEERAITTNSSNSNNNNNMRPRAPAYSVNTSSSKVPPSRPRRPLPFVPLRLYYLSIQF